MIHCAIKGALSVRLLIAVPGSRVNIFLDAEDNQDGMEITNTWESIITTAGLPS